jgi:hypothetical protein
VSALASLGGVALPWLLGSAFVLAVRPRGAPASGSLCWTLGAGWFAGVLLLTLWMRALAAASLSFAPATIAGPLSLAAAGLLAFALRRTRTPFSDAARRAWAELRGEGIASWTRTLWFALLGWLCLRAGLLLAEVAMRPLYPWEAWTRWATKARVDCALKTSAPFVDADGWFAAGGASWFDAAPHEPATLPLLQAWSCIAMNGWDDTLINLPWWLAGIALSLAIYGGLRAFGLAPLGALFGTWLVASLPLLDAQIALAGNADLFLAGFFTLSILALLRWQASRAVGDAVLAALFLAGCALAKSTGLLWVAAMIPGLCIILAPVRGVRVATALLGAAAVLLLVFARTRPTLGGMPLHLEFAPAWGSLGASLFLLDNWHLLWYGAAAGLAVAWRQALSPPIVPLTFMIAGGLMYGFAVFAFPGLTSALGDATTMNRTMLVPAPVVAVWLALTTRAWARRFVAARPPTGAGTEAP